MTGQWYRRIDERDQGRRRLNRLTGWAATAAVALAGVFGFALARQDRAAAAPVQQNPVTGDTTDGGGGGVTNPTDPGSGGVIQPPAQPPTDTRGRGHVSSGGS
jgi:hypothetical protein